MKKHIYLLHQAFCCLVFSVLTQAQNKPPLRDPSKEIQQAVANLPSTSRSDRVEIYQQPGFRGKVATYGGTITPFIYPVQFTNKKGISLKVAAGHIAYIAFKDEFGEESIFIGDHSAFGSSNPYEIKSIRVVPATSVPVNFCGISTQLHNNDCKRVFGTIRLRVFERAATGALIACPRTQAWGSPLRETAGDFTAAIILDKTISVSKPDAFLGIMANIAFSASRAPGTDKYLFNYDGTTAPVLNNPVVFSTGQAAGYGYTVSETALRENRIMLEIECDLGTQHKANDLGTDYSSSIKMGEKVKTLVEYQSSPGSFSIGDFELKGNPNNNYGMASGVKFSIIKKMRVHFNKLPTPARIR